MILPVEYQSLDHRINAKRLSIDIVEGKILQLAKQREQYKSELKHLLRMKQEQQDKKIIQGDYNILFN